MTLTASNTLRSAEKRQRAARRPREAPPDETNAALPERRRKCLLCPRCWTQGVLVLAAARLSAGSPRAQLQYNLLDNGAAEPTAGARFPSSKLKLDELFLGWLSLPESQKLVLSLLDDAKAGRPIGGPTATRSPLSPVAAASLHAASTAMPPLSPQKGSGHRHPLLDSGSPPMSPRSRTAAQLQSGSSAAAAAAKHRAAVPQFYFPQSRMLSREHAAAMANKINALFASAASNGMQRAAFADVVREVVELPSIFSGVLFDRLDAGGTGRVTREQFNAFWQERLAGEDTAGRAFEVLRRPGVGHITHADVKPLMRDLLATHPGLDFLREAPEFQERYCETVVHRLFYGVARADPARITLRELRRSDALEAMFAVDETDDINRVLRYFSYEHFYVIYCRFWELDTDHDFLLDREDLLRYGGHALTYRIVDRVFAGAGRPFTSGVPGRMGYEDFVWFVLSEEDKSSPAALAYWFRCVDLDGDGAIRPAEAAHFYEEQLQRMECLAQEPVAFEDVLCQMSDMLSPAMPGSITLADLRSCKLAGQFFNVLFNLGKFVAHEARDPFTIRAERDDPSLSDWDRFARAEYLRLSLEEEAEGAAQAGGLDDDAGAPAWEADR